MDKILKKAIAYGKKAHPLTRLGDAFRAGYEEAIKDTPTFERADKSTVIIDGKHYRSMTDAEYEEFVWDIDKDPDIKRLRKSCLFER